MAGLVRRIFLGQLAPLRPAAQDPQDSVEHPSRVLPGTTSTIRTSLRSQDRFDELPLGIAEFPSSSHALLLPAFLPAENNYIGSTTIYETSSSNFNEGTLLNTLLNEMDGLRDDADLLVILTTNRPDELEPALASRPGRIDQAIEFPLPDESGRAKLVNLYSCSLTLADQLTELIVSRTKGASPAFIKELMRRSAQFNFEMGGDGTLQQSAVDGALEEMLFRGGSLNLKLLGGSGLGFKHQDAA